MTETATVERLKEHTNAFGALRLLFAALVIVSHTPALVDGNEQRDPLFKVFGSITFGELAVDGFFLISGYLIVGSFEKRPNILPYMTRRIARIYPAFIVAWLVCLFIVAPLGGANLSDIATGLPASLIAMAQLQIPMGQQVFAGTFYPQLDSSMWTIRYEFLCYLLVILLGVAGCFRYRISIVFLAFAGLILYAIILYNGQLEDTSRSTMIRHIPHAANKIIELSSIFFTGSLFYLYKGAIRFTLPGVIIATVGVIICLLVPPVAGFGVAIFGGYLIFGTAVAGRSGILSKINNRTDISYGVYLYAWPIEKLLLWYHPHIAMVFAAIITLILSCFVGWLSWHLLEKPAMAFLVTKRRTQ